MRRLEIIFVASLVASTFSAEASGASRCDGFDAVESAVGRYSSVCVSTSSGKDDQVEVQGVLRNGRREIILKFASLDDNLSARLVTTTRRQWIVVRQNDEAEESTGRAILVTVISTNPIAVAMQTYATAMEIGDFDENGNEELLLFRLDGPSRWDNPIGWPMIVKFDGSISIPQLEGYPAAVRRFVELAGIRVNSIRDTCEEIVAQGSAECPYIDDAQILEGQIRAAEQILERVAQ